MQTVNPLPVVFLGIFVEHARWLLPARSEGL